MPFLRLGHGGIKEGQVVNKLIEEYAKANKPQIVDNEDILSEYNVKKNHGSYAGKGGIIVNGIDDVAVRFSKCCSPVPGDEIVGFITRGRGISIHRTDCVNVLCMSESDRNRVIEAEWKDNAVAEGTYMTEINIYADDRNGILFDITKILSELNINVSSINSRTSKQGKATITLAFAIRSKEQLNTIIAKIRNVDSIIDIERTMG
jgi:GTP pyrophosphokinase